MTDGFRYGRNADEELTYWRARREAERSKRLARRVARRRYYTGIAVAVFVVFAVGYLVAQVLLSLIP